MKTLAFRIPVTVKSMPITALCPRFFCSKYNIARMLFKQCCVRAHYILETQPLFNRQTNKKKKLRIQNRHISQRDFKSHTKLGVNKSSHSILSTTVSLLKRSLASCIICIHTSRLTAIPNKEQIQ